MLQTGGDVRAFLNVTARSVVGRDIYLFIGKNREPLRRLVAALSPNLTVERDVELRPRDHKPFLVRALNSRAADDRTILWTFSRLP